MTDAADPVGEFFRLWQAGPAPDLDAFLARTGALDPPTLASVIRIDLREHWRAGRPVRAEDYLRRFPQVAADSDAALALVYTEFLLTEEQGGDPDPDDFARRFPELADALRMQVAFHRGLAVSTATPSGQGPGGDTSTADLPGPPHLGPP